MPLSVPTAPLPGRADRALLPGVVVLALAVATVAGCVAPTPSSPSGGVDAAAVVPGTADVVVHVTPTGHAEDPAVEAFERYNLSETREADDAPGPPTDSSFADRETLRAIANSTRISWSAVRSVTLFARYPAPGDAGLPADGGTLGVAGPAPPVPGPPGVPTGRA
ncbi:MAG: hypothetical protein ABEJ42_10490, partial [Halobacteriaceae archaeon]